MTMNNPINGQVQPIAGRRLQPGELQQVARSAGGTYDRRPLEDLWKSPQWNGASVEKLGRMGIASIAKECQLSQPPHNG